MRTIITHFARRLAFLMRRQRARPQLPPPEPALPCRPEPGDHVVDRQDRHAIYVGDGQAVGVVGGAVVARPLDATAGVVPYPRRGTLPGRASVAIALAAAAVPRPVHNRDGRAFAAMCKRGAVGPRPGTRT